MDKHPAWMERLQRPPSATWSDPRIDEFYRVHARVVSNNMLTHCFLPDDEECDFSSPKKLSSDSASDGWIDDQDHRIADMYKLRICVLSSLNLCIFTCIKMYFFKVGEHCFHLYRLWKMNFMQIMAVTSEHFFTKPFLLL